VARSSLTTLHDVLYLLGGVSSRNPKWLLFGHFEQHQPQNFVDFSRNSSPYPTWFRDNRLKTFCVILVTNKQMDTGDNSTLLVEVDIHIGCC